MKIIGIGVDIVENSRIQKQLKNLIELSKNNENNWYWC